MKKKYVFPSIDFFNEIVNDIIMASVYGNDEFDDGFIIGD